MRHVYIIAILFELIGEILIFVNETRLHGKRFYIQYHISTYPHFPLRNLVPRLSPSYSGSLPRTQALSHVPTSYPGSSLVLRISSSYSGSLPRTQAPSYPGSLLEVILALTVYRMYTRCSNNIISTRIFLF